MDLVERVKTTDPVYYHSNLASPFLNFEGLEMLLDAAGIEL